MSGTADDDDYYMPHGTKIVMSYGPDGPSPQPVDGEMLTRPTAKHDADELECILAAERKLYAEYLTKSGRSIPITIPRKPLPPLPRLPRVPPLIVELALSDLIQEDE